jgi:hypothetical protein
MVVNGKKKWICTVCSYTHITPISMNTVHHTNIHEHCTSHQYPWTLYITPISMNTVHHTNIHEHCTSHQYPWALYIRPISMNTVHHTNIHEHCTSHQYLPEYPKYSPEYENFFLIHQLKMGRREGHNICKKSISKLQIQVATYVF